MAGMGESGRELTYPDFKMPPQFKDLSWKRLIVLAAIPLMWFGCMAVSAQQDRRTEHAVLRMINEELPSGATRPQVELFMRQHAPGAWSGSKADFRGRYENAVLQGAVCAWLRS